MDLFELFETDNDRPNRRNQVEQEEARKKGLRGFFQRWMAAVSDDEERPRESANTRRRETDRDWD